jgi:hypothetical protein
MQLFSLEKFPVGRAIFKDLTYNLNHWKRVEADKNSDANRHFYEKVVTRERLDAITRITGRPYPSWGEVTTDTNGHKLMIGIEEDGSPTKVGLRWAVDFGDWRFGTGRGSAQNGKNVRFVDGDDESWKPQIVATIRPLELWDFFRKKEPSGKRPFMIRVGDGWKFDPSKVESHPRWEEAKIVPLCFHLRIAKNAFAEDGVAVAAFIRPTEKAECYNADDPYKQRDPHYDAGEEFYRKMEFVDDLIQEGRLIASKLKRW